MIVIMSQMLLVCLHQTNIRNDDKGGDDDDGAENDVGDDSTEYKHKRD